MAQGDKKETSPKAKAVEIPEGTHSELILDLTPTGIKIQPTMYGIFFENINFGADGGLYGELIKNRSFEFPEAKMGWREPNSSKSSLNGDSGFGKITDYLDPKGNKRYSHTVVNNDENYLLFNEGFRGIGLKKGGRYDLSVLLANRQGIQKVKFALVDSTEAVLAAAEIIPMDGDWRSYGAVLVPERTEAKARLRISFEGQGSIDMDMVSLFPQDTWKGRKKGLRRDLVELLDGLKPGFLRFPGGCIVEGRTLDQRYQWKKTLGPAMHREILVNRWNTEFGHRPTPDYYQSFGIGFYEYFQLSEDLGAEPMPILGCGMACQFNTGELVPLEGLAPFVQEALDLIEFANGGVDTPWGKVRADMGHPEPFNMKYLGIGNEQWGPEYFERYTVFAEAIGQRYPEIALISTPGPFPDGDMFDYGWQRMRELGVAIADEHYYRSPEWFRENADRYDRYDRNGPKVFAGEYAAQSVGIASPDNRNNWECALAEAAFMTGLERNAEVVYLTSYAPLMAHAEGWQWTPDLIWFNNLEAFGTPNYHVQKLFSNHAGTDLLNLSEQGGPLIGQHALYGSAVKDSTQGELILKLVNTATTGQEVTIVPKGGELFGTAQIIVLGSNELDGENSFDRPKGIGPKEGRAEIAQGKLRLSLSAQSLNIVKIRTAGE